MESIKRERVGGLSREGMKWRVKGGGMGLVVYPESTNKYSEEGYYCYYYCFESQSRNDDQGGGPEEKRNQLFRPSSNKTSRDKGRRRNGEGIIKRSLAAR